MINWADVIDYGSAPEAFLHEAVKQNKIVFLRIERLLKEGDWKLLIPSVRAKYKRKYTNYKDNKNVYFLCVSGYTARDLQKINVKGERVLQWAYCPQFIEYPTQDVLKRAEGHKELQLFWCGRMIGWKHPEIAVKIADELNKRGVDFSLEMAGAGELEEPLKALISKKGLDEKVKMLGVVPVSEMRAKMCSMDLFIGTSDRNEGWGVVINEAMNSGCAVVASKETGAVPVLIQDGKNGFSFSWKDYKNAASQIERLDEDRELLRSMRINAYNTIKNDFCQDVYAKTFLEVANDALSGQNHLRSGLGSISLVR